MGTQTTFIPQEINLDDQVDKTFIDYKTVGTDKKITLGEKSINNLALLDLRATILEVDASITGATENFSDIFSDEDGLLDTVNTSDTTSVYDSNDDVYRNNKVNNYDTFSNDTNIDSQIVVYEAKKDFFLKSISLIFNNSNPFLEIKVDDVVYFPYDSITATAHELYKANVNATVKTGDIILITSNSTSIKASNVTIPINDYIQNSGSYTSLANYSTKKVNFEILEIDEAENKQINLNYDKANPVSFYGAIYSGSTDSEDIGDVDIELYDATDTLLATFTPFTLYTDLSFATDPTYIILRQNDTEISKISKFVFLIE